MSKYILGRLVATIPVMFTVLVVVFMLIHLGPGDPAAVLAGDTATPEQIAAIRAKLHLDQPLLFQFFLYLRQILSLDLGTSIYSGRPVGTIILQRVEPTILLAVLTTVAATLIAIPMGVVAAVKSGTIADRALILATVIGFSVPGFVVAYILIQVFAIDLRWLPVQGYKPLSQGIVACLRSLVLPIVVLTLVFSALVARITRATMIEVIGQDYIRTAIAKGAGTKRVVMVHALKNIGVPVITVIGSSFAGLLGGVVITESVFNLPGIGRLTVDAILQRDYPIVQGIMLLFAAMLVIINLLVDLSYAFFDPRIRQA
jgi:peptide/nickel transport system permease protein